MNRRTQHLVSPGVGTEQETCRSKTGSEEAISDTPSVYPMVQPMKAALYFESADGFGEWRIILSSRARRDIREKRRTDAKSCEIVFKKIRELSNGHFSDDNQKRLNSHCVGVPIYEAKMTRDQRLVYQVDCIREYGSNVDRQVLKIFGIYTHAQLDGRFWDSMGHQLAGYGNEYRRRCNFRNRPYHAGDNVIMPATFPASNPDDDEPSVSVVDLPPEDLDELHSLLVLGKFVALSQALLNSIIANQDVTYPFMVSPQEQEIIEHNSSCYVLGRSGTGKTTTMLYKILGMERVWSMHSNDMPKPRQLFVTHSRMLADKVNESFTQLMESLSTGSRSLQELAILRRKWQQRKERGLTNREDDVYWQDHLPERFSLLEDRHFPLFITFNKLCELLEADIGHPNLSRSVTKQPGSFLSYDVFHMDYWPHFPQSLTKRLDPALVFSEILGVIEGSELALTSGKRYLDQNTYENLGHHSQSMVPSQRSTIFSIFQLYLKRKRMEGQYDAADRTHAILNSMSGRKVQGRVDYLYVDEVQDNLLIDTLLLRSLCRNPHGLFWAGDTAQTISIGSSFRFQDLKSFLFRVEERKTYVDHCARSPARPPYFQLTVNYRSHGGIVKCAHTIIELITRFWKDSIDVLAKEKGVVGGIKPIFFHGSDSAKAEYEQFLSGTAADPIEFGHEQCILFRNQAALDKFRTKVGDVGILMTICDSKGLESNDVLLYNFFEDSKVDLSQWRVVLNGLQANTKPSVPAPEFDEIRHAGICNELKNLYVAITRARKNLWIIDCSNKGEPMRAVWSSKNQIDNHPPGADLPRLAQAQYSSPEEWATKGRHMFDAERYPQAMHCFEKAHMYRETDIAKAYFWRKKAFAAPLGTRHERTLRAKAFLDAAEAFIGCFSMAVTDDEKRDYPLLAADCYVNNGDNLKAARAYLDAKEYTLATQHFRKAGAFDDAVQVVRDHKEHIDPDIIENVMDIARLEYIRSLKTLCKAKELFSSTEAALQYADECGLDVAQAGLLEIDGRNAEAAEVHLANGRTVEAIRILLLKPGDEHCVQKANASILRGLWAYLSFGIPVETAKANTKLQELLVFAGKLSLESIPTHDRDEISMFRAIVSENLAQLQELALKFYLENNKPAALLCLDHIFIRPPQIQTATIQETVSLLGMFYTYASLLRDIAFLSDPCALPLVQKLLAFEGFKNEGFSISPGTFLYDQLSAQQAHSTNEEEVRVISRLELSRVLKYALSERLRSRVMLENEICRRAKVFSPCLYALLGTCTRPECPRDHVDPSTLKLDWYNNRVRIHLQQIQIFQTLHFINLGPERGKQHKYWLDRLYEALHPYFYAYGCRANLVLRLIPGAERAMAVVQDWARHMIYTSDPVKYPSTFLTTFMRSAIFSFDHDGKWAISYISRAPCILYIDPPRILIHKDHNRYIVNDLVTSLHGNHPACLSTGVLFIRHVVEEKIPINISLLCDFIENICGSFVVALRLQKIFTLHDITLPKSWLVSLWRNIQASHTRDTMLYWVFVEPLVSLIGQIFLGSNIDYLLHENRDLSTLFGPIRSVFISRICRALCLLGYNIRNDEFRQKICQGITSMNKGDRPLPPLYRRYFEAKHWSDLVNAVRLSTTDSPMDEIIQLYHEGRIQGPLLPIRGIRRVVFRTLDQIPSLIDTHHLMSVLNQDRSTSTLSTSTNGRVLSNVPGSKYTCTAPGAQDEVASEANSSPTFSIDNQIDHKDIGDHGVIYGEAEVAEEVDSVEELELEPTVDTEALAQSVNTAIVCDAMDGPSHGQIQAARTIQAFYRQCLRRRHARPKTMLSEMRSRFVVACWAQSQMMDWPPSRFLYRFLFLGPLPHILLSLERAIAYASKLKTKAKGRLIAPNLKHQELEDVQMEMNKSNRLLKDLRHLQRELEPKAALHRSRDLEALKARVQQVDSLIRGLPCAQELRLDLDLAVKGIVATKITTRKRQKPRCCSEEDAPESLADFPEYP